MGNPAPCEPPGKKKKKKKNTEMRKNRGSCCYPPTAGPNIPVLVTFLNIYEKLKRFSAPGFLGIPRLSFARL